MDRGVRDSRSACPQTWCKTQSVLLPPLKDLHFAPSGHRSMDFVCVPSITPPVRRSHRPIITPSYTRSSGCPQSPSSDCVSSNWTPSSPVVTCLIFSWKMGFRCYLRFFCYSTSKVFMRDCVGREEDWAVGATSKFVGFADAELVPVHQGHWDLSCGDAVVHFCKILPTSTVVLQCGQAPSLNHFGALAKGAPCQPWPQVLRTLSPAASNLLKVEMSPPTLDFPAFWMASVLFPSSFRDGIELSETKSSSSLAPTGARFPRSPKMAMTRLKELRL